MMKQKPKKTIMHTLFIPYVMLFILSFIIIAVFFVITESKKIRDHSMTSIENNVISISDTLDTTIDGLDMVSQNIIFSNLIKKHFSTYRSFYDETNTYKNELKSWYNVQNNKTLYDLLTALIGSKVPVDQVNLYSLDGGVFSAGLNNITAKDNVKKKEWYPTVTALSGKKYVYLESNSDLEHFFSYSNGGYFLSLSRMYYNSLNSPQGIVEVKKSFANILNVINHIHYAYQEQVYIYDSDGKCIYPLTPKKDDIDYYSMIQNKDLPETKATSLPYKYFKKKQQHLLYQQSSYSGFNTIIVVDNKALMKPIYQYLITMLLILFFICTATIVLSYVIARRICMPLNKMHQQLQAFHLTGDIRSSNFQEIHINVTEINTLYQAFIKMQEQAKVSMKNELLLQSREMQSKMLALQAQMNPHFLYNSLSTIQAMADEEMNEEIINMCQNISRMLRYISANDNPLVHLSDEIRHTKDYMECMRIRYSNELSYTISLPDELLLQKIPKLCLQLIVENAIKFTTSIKAPWHIHISGNMTSTHWEIQIKDNGPGFTEEKLQELNQKVLEINETGSLPNLEINGMGLMNIYIRFKLLYKGSHIFRFCNHATQGAIVTIGNSLI
jgi:sensor histidine kinase YesM